MVISSRKFENFELFCPLGAMKLGIQQKKWLYLIQPSQDPTYIYFFNSGVNGTCRNGDKEWTSMYVCVTRLFHLISPRFMVPSIYGTLVLLNFCANRVRGLGAKTKLLGVSNWRKLLRSKVLGIYLKWSLAKKIFPKTTPIPKKFKKITNKGSLSGVTPRSCWNFGYW